MCGSESRRRQMQARSLDFAQAIAHFRVALKCMNSAIVRLGIHGKGPRVRRLVCAAQRSRLMQACMTEAKYHSARSTPCLHSSHLLPPGLPSEGAGQRKGGQGREGRGREGRGREGKVAVCWHPRGVQLQLATPCTSREPSTLKLGGRCAHGTCCLHLAPWLRRLWAPPAAEGDAAEAREGGRGSPAPLTLTGLAWRAQWAP